MTTPDRWGVQLYSLRDALTAELPGSLDRLAEAGYTTVEPFAITAWRPTLPDALAARGLVAPSVHADLLGDDLHHQLDVARAFGASTVIVPAVPPERFTSSAGVRQVADALNDAAAAAAGVGMVVGYHNHHFEFLHQVDGTSAYEAFVSHLAPEVVLELDTYWAAAGGQDVPALLSRLGSRVRLLHVKDGPIDLESAHVGVGEGRMPVWDVLDAASHAELAIVELDTCDGDVFDALTRSLAYLRAGRPA